MFAHKRILITGGAGFVGSHLAEKLIERQAEVISLDNYLSGRQENHIEGVSYVEGDVIDVVDIFGSVHFDYIFHFGEYSRVEQSLDEPHVALSNIYKSFSSILHLWQISGAKLIYSGSSTKFSDNGKGEHLSPYTAAKSLNTKLLIDFSKWYNLSCSIVYFYNVYGGRELRSGRYSTVIGKYKELRKSGATNLPVSSPGTQRRNFTHIDDIVRGVILAAEKGDGDGYGIGAKEAHTILDVCRAFGCEPQFQESSSANRLDGELRTEKIKRLGWTQKNLLMPHIATFLKGLDEND
ncbi:NAD-dependent epimerase/dehydratase family protein [Planktomarina temperata]|nr:NAD-dependent epimerase/dehydratase family protein [Planktomarina temperata]